jgi:diadenosine tetraphosphate (Ap4A) HIT family hydrolase/5-methylcytosine-specific restriction endonuclease McrA
MAVAFLDAFPVNPGHTLIVPRRHVANFFDLSDQEQAASWMLLPLAKRAIDDRHAPAAYNVGVNVGAAAGQTVAHARSPIPRHSAMSPDPRGVRWVIPERPPTGAVGVTREQGAIALAERVLAVLDEGTFSACMQFALFTAILGVCIERTSRHGLPPPSSRRANSQPECSNSTGTTRFYGASGVLRQGAQRRRSGRDRAGSSGPGAVGRLRTDTLFRARLDHRDEFSRLLDFTEWKLIEMPIPRLQKLGHREDQFLYRYNWTPEIRRATVSEYQRGGASRFDNRLLLRPGVAENLVRLNGVLRPLFYRQWALMVASMNRLPEAELERFLFGSERVPLDAIRAPLRDLQDDRCFYCHRRLDRRAEVDHFVPWSRYPDDGLDNLVAADPGCNGSKRDFLAAAEHVEHWARRSQELDGQLADIAREIHWHRDAGRSRSVASAMYLRLPGSARLWIRGSEFGPLERDRIRQALDG